VNPDIAVFAKGIGNGHPIGAVIGRATVMQAAQETFISSTSWTERVGPVAALATIRKHRRVRAAERLVAAGQRVQQMWKDVATRAGLACSVGPADMPPLSHLYFDGPDARAVQTLHCQMMLDRGYMDNTGFYATYAHTDDVLVEYEGALGEVFPVLAAARRDGQVESLLRGPVGHSGFARLT
jgi:glutamate-1-semialdehyde 2,1-aminomutase